MHSKLHKVNERLRLLADTLKTNDAISFGRMRKKAEFNFRQSNKTKAYTVVYIELALFALFLIFVPFSIILTTLILGVILCTYLVSRGEFNNATKNHLSQYCDFDEANRFLGEITCFAHQPNAADEYYDRVLQFLDVVFPVVNKNLDAKTSLLRKFANRQTFFGGVDMSPMLVWVSGIAEQYELHKPKPKSALRGQKSRGSVSHYHSNSGSNTTLIPDPLLNMAVMNSLMDDQGDRCHDSTHSHGESSSSHHCSDSGDSGSYGGDSGGSSDCGGGGGGGD